MSDAEVMPGPTMMAAAEHVTLSRDMCAHTHDFAEISLVTAGSAEHFGEEGTAFLSPGSLVMLGPSSWHSIASAKNLEMTNLYLSTRMLELAAPVPAVVEAMRAVLSEISTLGSVTMRELSPADTAELSQTLSAFVRNPGTTVLAQLSGVYAILDRLVTICREETATAADPLRYEHATLPTNLLRLSPRISHAVSILHDRLEYSWSLASLAKEIAISPSQLTRGFRADLGMGPMSYLQQLRAERMAYLLRTTNLTVSAAGRAVGWSDPSYASRRFSKHWGLSPSWYLVRVQTGTAPVPEVERNEHLAALG
ncbi:helix-turn-helix domain-containing protein [Leucobacter sp. UCMA 4100]|uniref:AraC family transcriptional regulator n=1 Tax=Leucobacter sp. UCMA 4100 TaxID=2810534 RepID=UPI0022EA1C8E|nr:AraC family transcriptional regulator [Leucobacter sp. UCMA 4100]MDA3147595.1 helix-turn-helix domain-containing protein [Leucobacter sp. UCMA 4100]